MIGVFGTVYDDDLYGRDAAESFYGDAGDDVIVGAGGDDLLNGAEGDDFVIGGVGNDHMQGAIGDDTLLGRSGNDQIWGGDGSDLIRGGDGDDVLIGGRGVDHLYGGAGNDTFVFEAVDHSPKGAKDIITDFASGDRVDLSAIGGDLFFVGRAKFDDEPGEVQFRKGKIRADTDGDGMPDFVVKLVGVDKIDDADLIL